MSSSGNNDNNTGSANIAVTEEFQAATVKIGRALSNHLTALPEILFKPPTAGTLSVQQTRGMMDRRGRAFAGIPEDSILEAAPKSEKALAAWLAFMDALADVKSDWRGLDGAKENARAYREHIFEKEFKVEGYDTAAAVLAWDYFKSVTPDFTERMPDIAERLTDELIQSAKTRTTLHAIINIRLEKDRDLLEMTQDDPSAFAFRLSKLIKDDLTTEEQMLFQEFLILVPEDLKDKGFYSLESLFEKEEEVEQRKKELDELITRKKERIKSAYDEISKNSSDQSRRTRRKLLKRAKKIFSDEKKNLENGINEFRRDIRRFKDAIEKPEASLKDKEIHPDEFFKPAELLTPSPNLGDFSYYTVAPHIKDVFSTASAIMPEKLAKEAVEGLYTKFGDEFKRANAVGRKIRAHFMAPREIRIERDLEEGTLDPAMLTRLIIDPTYDRPYMHRHEKSGRDLDTAVTILVDNSGSMTAGNKIQLAMIAADRLSYWLNNAGFPTEILGFTTVISSYLSSVKLRQDRLHHILYKDFQENHSEKTTRSLAAMLKHHLHQSNIDGEAVAWAHNRALRTPHTRRILMVLSDGMPAGNAPHVDRHLRDTVAWVEKNSPVEIIGIGIKTDVGKFYSNSIRIESPYELIDTMAEKLKEIVDTPEEYNIRLRRKGRSIAAAQKGPASTL